MIIPLIFQAYIRYVKKIIKAFSIVTGFSIATRLISFGFKIWMSRALGAEAVGLYQIALSVLLLFFTITAGAPTVLSRKIAEAQSQNDTKKQNSLTTASLIIGISVSVIMCVCLWLARNSLSFLFADDRCVDIFLIMSPALITSTLYTSFRSWFWGRKRFLEFSATELFDEIFRIVLSVIFAGGLISSLSGAKGAALGLTISDILCVLILGILFFKKGGRLTKPTGFKEIIKATIPLSATRILNNLTASLTALIIPQQLVKAGMPIAFATAEFGRISGMAFPLIMAPITIVSSLAVVLIPDIAELNAQNNALAISKKLTRSINFAFLVSSIFFVIYLPFGKYLGELFFNDAAAGTFVSYCSLLLYPISIVQTTLPVLNSLGKEKNTFINSLLGAAFIPICIFILPRYIGVYAMAVGSGISFAVTSILNLICLKKTLGILPKLRNNIWLTLFSCLLSILTLLTMRLLTPFTGKYLAIAVCTVYILLFMFIFIDAFKIIDFKYTLFMILPKKERHSKQTKKLFPKKQTRKNINRKIKV